MKLERDAKLLLASQAARAFGYGMASVLVPSTLSARGFSPFEVGLVLGAVVAGTVAAQLSVARWSNRWGRRRFYLVLHLALAVSGWVFAANSSIGLLVAVSLLGALSTEVVESGPFTSLELAMLSGRLTRDSLASRFGWYNAIATTAGALGAAAAGLPERARAAWPTAPPDHTWMLLLVVVATFGAMVAARLSRDVEVGATAASSASLGPSRTAVLRLSGLFSLDAFAGGFVVQAFIAYWLIDRLGATTASVGVLFAVIGVVQTLSFLVAPMLARRIGLLNTMVFSHLPSNLLLASLAWAPGFTTAAVLLMCRAALSQMDVPTRQAYVMALVRPEERTAAIAYTNTARYIVRPVGPLTAGVLLAQAAGAPFLAAATAKIAYDLILWSWFRKVPLPLDSPAPPETQDQT